MDEFEDLDVPFTLWPGVDLGLWVRITIALVVIAAATGAILLYL